MSRTNVFAATTGGLVIYDRRFEKWEPPLTRVDGFPDFPLRAALVDPADDAVWLAGDAGLVHYQPQIRRLEVFMTGPIVDLMFDRDDPVRGLFVRGRGGWEFLTRGQAVTFPASDLPPRARWIQPVSLRAALDGFPAAEAMGATTLLDRRLRRFSYTAAGISPEKTEAFFGTDGIGLFRLDALSSRLEPLPFGLRSPDVGSVLVVPGGVWLGMNDGGASHAPGFVRLWEDLQNVRYDEGGTASPVFREEHDLLARGTELWAATDRGVFRFEPGGPWRVMDVGDGLPGDRCLALSQGAPGVWVGTERGLALVHDDGTVARVGPASFVILALSAAGDSALVGTNRGLLFAAAGMNLLVMKPDVADEPVLSGPIVALVRVADTVVAATPRQIVWKPPAGRWMVERVLPEIGDLRSLAPDRGGVWVGGERGFGFFRFNGRGIVTFHSPEDLPGAVRRMAVGGPYLWLATQGGLVRYRRRVLVP
ncbi:MAG: hypothetical protein HY700_21415 [Gemmatimonadetes bacterium]|nr:hypothetical protein [Gemmatimonadota bacterium]